MLRHLSVLSVIVGFLVVGSGCGKLLGGDGEDDEADSGAPSNANPSATDACGGAEFPCSWGDVSEEVVTRTRAVAGEAMGVGLLGRSAKEVSEELAKADDIVVLGYSEEAIRYRVRGGRPAWVFLATANTIGKKATIGGPISISPLSWMGPAAAAATPTGKQDKGTRPKKRALILSPFRWQWQLGGNDDEVEVIKGYFDKLADYENGVDLRQNTWNGQGIDVGMGLADFENWREYDVVHVSTHGTSCDGTGPRCATSLATGDIWPEALREKNLPPEQGVSLDVLRMLRDEKLGQGLDMGFMPITQAAVAPMKAIPGLHVVEVIKPVGMLPSGAKPGDTTENLMAGDTKYFAGPFVLATTRFFEQAYGKKPLTDKLVFLSACKSGTKSDLMKTLAGPATAVIGWDKVMALNQASAAAAVFWFYMTNPSRGMTPSTEKGRRTVSNAFKKLEDDTNNSAVLEQGPLKSIVIEGVLTEDDVTGAKLQPSGDGSVRVAEIIRLLDPKGERELVDGDFVPMVGAPGDGEPDSLELHAELVGIGDEDKADGYVIHVDVDGREATGTFKPTEKVEDGVWRAKAKVELGFDLSGDPFVLEPWVEMPTGGVSRWYYEDIGVQYFVITVSGPGFGTPQTFAMPRSLVGFNVFAGGGFISKFRANLERAAVSKDDSVLEWMAGGVGKGLDTLGTHPLGQGGPKGNSNRWTMMIYLQAAGCPPNYRDCDAVTLTTRTGTMKVKKFQLGASRFRPGSKGPTMMTATFEVAAEAVNEGHKGEMFSIKGMMSLAQ